MSAISVPGRLAGRFIKSLAIGEGQPLSAVAYAESQPWLERDQVVKACKAAVSPMDSGSLEYAMGPVRVDFMAALRPVSVISRLTGARHYPLNTRLIVTGTGTVGYAVAEGAAKPLSKASLAGTQIEPRKSSAMTVLTRELMRAAAPGSDSAIALDLAAAVGAVEDTAFLTPATAGSILTHKSEI